MKTIAVYLSAIATFLAVPFAGADEIHIYASSSPEAPLREMAAAFEKGGDDKLMFHFGNSDELARAIKEGASGDVFFFGQ